MLRFFIVLFTKFGSWFALWTSDGGGMETLKEEQKELSAGIKWSSELLSPGPYFVDWINAEFLFTGTE